MLHVSELVSSKASSYLDGWIPVADMQSISDIQEIFRQLPMLGEDCETLLLSEVAASMVEYRTTLTFVDDGIEHIGIVFFKRAGSLFLVFRFDEEKSVSLYHMGMSLRTDNPEAKILRRCSRIMRAFSTRLDEAFFDLRDELIGRFGIPGAAP